MSAKAVLFLILGVFVAAYLYTWVASVVRSRRQAVESPVGPLRAPSPLQAAIGFGTNFFDTLGIGSYAPTTSIFKLLKLVPDERIPGTLNVGHILPTVTQALIYITIVEVEMTTLVLLIAASVLGAWFGAGVVAAWPRRKIQIGMALALLAAASFFAMANLQLFPAGGDTMGLTGVRMAAGIAGNLVLGALMTLGIGLYAPCMILVSLLGMNPTTAFPIMMGSCAFLMPAASIRFIQKESYSLRPAIGLGLGGIPGVLIAAFIVRSLKVEHVRWLVVVVVVYTAVTMLRSALSEAARARESRAQAAS